MKHSYIMTSPYWYRNTVGYRTNRGGTYSGGKNYWHRINTFSREVYKVYKVYTDQVNLKAVLVFSVFNLHVIGIHPDIVRENQRFKNVWNSLWSIPSFQIIFARFDVSLYLKMLGPGFFFQYEKDKPLMFIEFHWIVFF